MRTSRENMLNSRKANLSLPCSWRPKGAVLRLAQRVLHLPEAPRQPRQEGGRRLEDRQVQGQVRTLVVAILITNHLRVAAVLQIIHSQMGTSSSSELTTGHQLLSLTESLAGGNASLAPYDGQHSASYSGTWSTTRSCSRRSGSAASRRTFPPQQPPATRGLRASLLLLPGPSQT